MLYSTIRFLVGSRFLRIRKRLLAGVLLAIIILTAAALMPIAPSGRFFFPKVSSEGNPFLAFEHGRVSVIIVNQQETQSTRAYTFGTYEHRKGEWVIVTESGDPYILYCNALFIRFRLPDGRHDTLWRRSF